MKLYLIFNYIKLNSIAVNFHKDIFNHPFKYQTQKYKS